MAQHPDTLFALLDSQAETGAQCLIDDGLALSWGQVRDQSQSLAAGLQAAGIKAGDRIALWLPNRAAWLTSFFACAQLGVIAVSINTRFRSAEVGDLLRRSAARLLIYWPSYKAIDFDAILDACPRAALAGLDAVVLYGNAGAALPAQIAGKPTIAFEALLDHAPLRAAQGVADSPCVIFTTSGTTKAPKLVLHSQRNVLQHGRNVARQYGLNTASRFLLVPPFCGVYGFCSAMAALVAGAPLILFPTWDAATFADAIDQHGVTHLNASNEAVAHLLQQRSALRPFPSIAFIGAANFDPAYADVPQRAAARGIEVLGLYGSSELQAVFSLRQRGGEVEQYSRPGGTPASATARVRARDTASGQLCEPGQAGELEFLATESRFVEYLDDANATAQALTADGYFKSGDLGLVEADGAFTYLARIGDALRLGGFLVSPAEIEDVIQQHASVLGCQIVAVQIGDAMRPIAFVTTPPASVFDEQEVIGYTARQLAKYKVPARIFVVDAFPTTPSANGSKIQKTKLRQMAESLLAQAS